MHFDPQSCKHDQELVEPDRRLAGFQLDEEAGASLEIAPKDRCNP